jgi:hypothetical protein
MMNLTAPSFFDICGSSDEANEDFAAQRMNQRRQKEKIDDERGKKKSEGEKMRRHRKREGRWVVMKRLCLCAVRAHGSFQKN